MSLTIQLQAGDETITVPAIYEVCSRCQGHGVHDHPAFSNGITDEEFRQDPGFREEYMAGTYDVTCDTCHGQRVVLVPNRQEIDPKILQQIDEDAAELAKMYAIEAAERRMGA